MTDSLKPAASESTGADDLSMLELLIVLAKHKKFIIGVPILVGIIAAGFSLSMPNIYTATAKILPPQQSQSAASAMLSQLGNVAGLVGGAVGIKSPSDLYVGMLKSRTVADNLIQRFNLSNLYGARYQSQVRAQLASASNIAAEKDGIITINVDDKDPKHAADIANGYVDELMRLTSVLAVTEASQRRLFFERQLAQAKENLLKAETAARQALARGGLVKVDDQGRAMVENTARLRAQITVKQVQIAAMRSFATERNSDLLFAQQELEAMKRELAKFESSGDVAHGSNTNVQSLENLGLLRDVKYHETIFELLARQYELAKVDEAKDPSIIQVLDKAVEPDRKSKPGRALIVLSSAMVAFLVAVMWAFFREAMAKANSDPRQAEQLKTFKGYLRWRRTG